MSKKLFYILILLFVISNQIIFSQQEKPQVALVLSGGGAKGIAHIPLLQTLDSLGIVPDLIVGTSMGSVVGGLYAMGYSGDSIAVLVKNIDWNELLGGDISLIDVSVEEKSEFKKYLIDLDLIKGKPKLSSALLKDQKLREYMSILTYPVFNITDFDNLSIPYRAVTTDIVNGNEIIIGKGSLSLAMRASMSIPGVFKPIPYENTLLVDGGVLNNFPVDIAKNMGDYFIIGSDVGGGMEPKEKLDNIATLLFQAAMLTSNLKNPENRKLCDILIDHVPYLTYSTGDFEKGNELYEEGKLATQLNISVLATLANKLHAYKQRIHKLPELENEIILDTIIYNNISKGNLDLVKARTNLLPHKKYTAEDIINGIDRAMGTTRFSQIAYHGVTNEEETKLYLDGFEHSKNQIKGSLHYDSYRSVGLVINYTGRNIIGQASRFLISVDIAEQPRYRLEYQKNFGDEKTFWWRSEIFGEYLKQKVFVNGESADDMQYNYFQFDNQINKNINSFKSYVGIGINYENTSIKPTTNTDFTDNILDLKQYYFNNLEVYAHYKYSNMNKVFYPTEGTFLQAYLGRSLLHDVDLEYADETTPDVKGETNSFTRLGLNFEKRIPFHKNITGIFGATAGFIFEDPLKSEKVTFTDYGYAAKYFLGGNLINQRKGRFIFPGLHEDELSVNQFLKLNLALQFSPIKKLYLTPHLNVASVGFGDFNEYIKDVVSPNGNWQDMMETSSLISAGATLSYESFLGPIDFDVSWVNDINKVRVFFSIGLQFNRASY